MRFIFAPCLICLTLIACTPEDIEPESGPAPMAVSLSERRGVMFVELENGRTCRAKIPDVAENGGKGALERCPAGYTWQLERKSNGFGRIFAALAVAATDIFGTHRPRIGTGTVTITTPDQAVSVFEVGYEEEKFQQKLVQQRAAPASPAT